MKQILLYLPVLHRGYEEFFARHPDAASVLLLGPGFAGVFPALAKDIRALPPPGPPPTCGWPGPARTSRSSSPATCPARSPATRWCCPTRRSPVPWPASTTWAGAAR